MSGPVELGAVVVNVIPSVAGAMHEMTKGGGQAADAFATGFNSKFSQSFQDLPKESMSAFKSFGSQAANTFMEGFQEMSAGKGPDMLKIFDTFEEGITKMVNVAGLVTGIGAPFAVALDAIKPFFDQFKALGGEFSEELLEIGDKYIEASRKISSSTIDTGQIKGLTEAVRDIMGSGAVVHFDDVAESIGRLNTNIKGIDLTQLKELTTTFAEAEEILGHIDETKFAGILNAWNIDAKDADETLTKLVNTASATGISFNSLTDEMTRVGPAMREMGYGVDQTATFFSRMTQEGEKGTRLIFAFNQIVKKLNDQVATGVYKNVQAGWEDIVGSVQRLIKAGDEVDAGQLLAGLVPANSVPLLLEDIRKGVLNTANAMEVLQGTGTELGKRVEETKNLGDAWEIVGQQMQAALEPVGEELAHALIHGSDQISDWLEDNQGKVAVWGANIEGIFIDGMGKAINFMADMMEAFKTPLMIFQKVVVGAVIGAVEAVKPILAGLSLLPDSIGGGAFSDALNDLKAAGPALHQAFDFDMSGGITKLDQKAKDFANKTLPQVRDQLKGVALSFDQKVEVTNALSSRGVDGVMKPQYEPVKDDKGTPIGKDAEHPMLQLQGDPANWQKIADNMRQLGVNIRTNTLGVVTEINYASQKGRDEWTAYFNDQIKNPPTTKVVLQPEDADHDPLKDTGDLLKPGKQTIGLSPTGGTGDGSSSGGFVQKPGLDYSGGFSVPRTIPVPGGSIGGTTPGFHGGGGFATPGSNVAANYGAVPNGPASSDQTGIARYIFGQALQKHYTPQQATSIVAYAMGESSLNPGISGGQQGGDEVIGLFQEQGQFASRVGIDPSQRNTVAGNVEAYLRNLEPNRNLPMDAPGQGVGALATTSVGGPLATGPGSQPQAWAPLVQRAINALGFDPSQMSIPSAPATTPVPSPAQIAIPATPPSAPVTLQSGTVPGAGPAPAAPAPVTAPSAPAPSPPSKTGWVSANSDWKYFRDPVTQAVIWAHSGMTTPEPGPDGKIDWTHWAQLAFKNDKGELVNVLQAESDMRQGSPHLIPPASVTDTQKPQTGGIPAKGAPAPPDGKPAPPPAGTYVPVALPPGTVPLPAGFGPQAPTAEAKPGEAKEAPAGSDKSKPIGGPIPKAPSDDPTRGPWEPLPNQHWSQTDTAWQLREGGVPTAAPLPPAADTHAPETHKDDTAGQTPVASRKSLGERWDAFLKSITGGDLTTGGEILGGGTAGYLGYRMGAGNLMGSLGLRPRPLQGLANVGSNILHGEPVQPIRSFFPFEQAKDSKLPLVPDRFQPGGQLGTPNLATNLRNRRIQRIANMPRAELDWDEELWQRFDALDPEDQALLQPYMEQLTLDPLGAMPPSQVDLITEKMFSAKANAAIDAAERAAARSKAQIPPFDETPFKSAGQATEDAAQAPRLNTIYDRKPAQVGPEPMGEPVQGELDYTEGGWQTGEQGSLFDFPPTGPESSIEDWFPKGIGVPAQADIKFLEGMPGQPKTPPLPRPPAPQDPGVLNDLIEDILMGRESGISDSLESALRSSGSFPSAQFFPDKGAGRGWLTRPDSASDFDSIPEAYVQNPQLRTKYQAGERGPGWMEGAPSPEPPVGNIDWSQVKYNVGQSQFYHAATGEPVTGDFPWAHARPDASLHFGVPRPEDLAPSAPERPFLGPSPADLNATVPIPTEEVPGLNAKMAEVKARGTDAFGRPLAAPGADPSQTVLRQMALNELHDAGSIDTPTYNRLHATGSPASPQPFTAPSPADIKSTDVFPAAGSGASTGPLEDAIEKAGIGTEGAAKTAAEAAADAAVKAAAPAASKAATDAATDAAASASRTAAGDLAGDVGRLALRGAGGAALNLGLPMAMEAVNPSASVDPQGLGTTGMQLPHGANPKTWLPPVGPGGDPGDPEVRLKAIMEARGWTDPSGKLRADAYKDKSLAPMDMASKMALAQAASQGDTAAKLELQRRATLGDTEAGNLRGTSLPHFDKGGWLSDGDDVSGDDPRIKNWEKDRARWEIDQRIKSHDPLVGFDKGGWSDIFSGPGNVPHGTFDGTGGSLAIYHPEEHVWAAPEVKAAHGHFNLQKLRGLALAGKIPKFDGGSGAADYVQSGRDNDAPELVDPQLQYIMKMANSMGLTLTAGKSGHGTHDPDKGWHDSGQAGDFGDGVAQPTDAKLQFARMMFQHFGSELSELIYGDPANMPKLIKDGQVVDAQSCYGPWLAGHRDHVHVAIRASQPLSDALQPGSDPLVPGGANIGGPGGSGGSAYQPAQLATADSYGGGGGGYGGGGFGGGGGGGGGGGNDYMNFSNNPFSAASKRGKSFRGYVAKVDEYNDQIETDQANISKYGGELSKKLGIQSGLMDQWNELTARYRDLISKGATDASLHQGPKSIGAQIDAITAKLDTLNPEIENTRQSLKGASDSLRDKKLTGPPAMPSEMEIKPDKDAESLGSGLITGLFQGMGFPDVFGKAFTQWGSYKLLMGGLGWGMNQLAPLMGMGGGGSGDTDSTPFGTSPLVGGGILGAFKNLMPGQQHLPNAAYTPTNIYAGFPGLDPAAGGTPDLGAGGLGVDPNAPAATGGGGGFPGLNLIPGLGNQVGQAPGPAQSGAPAPARDSGAPALTPDPETPNPLDGVGLSSAFSRPNQTNFNINPQGIMSPNEAKNTIHATLVNSSRGISSGIHPALA